MGGYSGGHSPLGLLDEVWRASWRKDVLNQLCGEGRHCLATRRVQGPLLEWLSGLGVSRKRKGC